MSPDMVPVQSMCSHFHLHAVLYIHQLIIAGQNINSVCTVYLFEAVYGQVVLVQDPARVIILNKHF